MMGSNSGPHSYIESIPTKTDRFPCRDLKTTIYFRRFVIMETHEALSFSASPSDPLLKVAVGKSFAIGLW